MNEYVLRRDIVTRRKPKVKQHWETVLIIYYRCLCFLFPKSNEIGVKQTLCLKESWLLRKNIWKQYFIFLKIAQPLLQKTLVSFPAQNWLESYRTDGVLRQGSSLSAWALFLLLVKPIRGNYFSFKPITHEALQFNSTALMILNIIVKSTWLESHCCGHTRLGPVSAPFDLTPHPPHFSSVISLPHLSLLATPGLFNFPEHTLSFPTNTHSLPLPWVVNS